MTIVATIKDRLEMQKQQQRRAEQARLELVAAYNLKRRDEWLKLNPKEVIETYLLDHPADIIYYPIKIMGDDDDWTYDVFKAVNEWFKDDGFRQIYYDNRCYPPSGSDSYSNVTEYASYIQFVV